jgi:hypothetical protein
MLVRRHRLAIAGVITAAAMIPVDQLLRIGTALGAYGPTPARAGPSPRASRSATSRSSNSAARRGCEK